MCEYSHLPVGHLPKLGCAHKLEGLVHAQLAVLLIRDDLCAQPSRGCCVHARADPHRCGVQSTRNASTQAHDRLLTAGSWAGVRQERGADGRRRERMDRPRAGSALRGRGTPALTTVHGMVCLGTLSLSIVWRSLISFVRRWYVCASNSACKLPCCGATQSTPVPNTTPASAGGKSAPQPLPAHRYWPGFPA
jgi:hypothetical protein